MTINQLSMKGCDRKSEMGDRLQTLGETGLAESGGGAIKHGCWWEISPTKRLEMSERSRNTPSSIKM